MVAIWIIVAIILFGVLTYIIGRTADPKSHDLGAIIFVAGMGSVLWPVVLIAALILGPFIIPYQLGVRNRAKALEKETMWNTLKK